MKKYLIKYSGCVQTGPDEWEMISNEKLFDDTATVADIKEWVRNRSQPTNVSFRLFEVRLSEPEQ